MRRIARTDIAGIMKLEEGAIDHPWEQQAIEALYSSDMKTALVETDAEGDLIGYVGAEWVLDEGNIGNLAVAPGHRRKGIARRLMEEIEKDLKGHGITVIFLEVRHDNEAAIALYTSLGYKTYNSRKDYYGEGKDALLMKKSI